MARRSSTHGGLWVRERHVETGLVPYSARVVTAGSCERQ